MPNKASARKELRKAVKRGAINKQVKDAYKTAVKAVNKAIEAGEKDVTEKMRLAQKKLDKAAKRGVIKKNTASRKISRLAARAKKQA